MTNVTTLSVFQNLVIYAYIAIGHMCLIGKLIKLVAKAASVQNQ